MKKIVIVLMLVMVALTFAAKSFAETNSPDAKDSVGAMTDPTVVAGYDEKTKAAWLEIQNFKMKGNVNGFLALSAALAIGLAAFGGALGQGRVSAAAVEGVARNPETNSKIFTMLIISMALIESLVIYALVIAFILQGKM